MAPKASPSRSAYHSPLRARQAAETRRSIVLAALEQFAANGWTATTLPAIAKAAGVSVDTIYATFGNKAAVLLDVVEVAIVGDDGETPMAERDDFAQLAKGRKADRIRAGVRYTMAVYDRSVPILRTLREAAASDAVARERYERYDRDRRDLVAAGMTLIAGGEPSDAIVDAVWALVSPEVHTYLLDGCGWTHDAVEDWFVDMVRTTLDRR